MARNKIVGKNITPKSNKATGRNYAYDKQYQSSPERKRYRAQLNKEARQRGIYGKRHSNGVDLSHTKSGKMVLEKRSTNRARNGKAGKSSKK